MTRTLASLESRFNRLYHDSLVLRIAYLETMLQDQAPGPYEVVYDLRKMTPDERARVLAIYADVQAREAGNL